MPMNTRQAHEAPSTVNPSVGVLIIPADCGAANEHARKALARQFGGYAVTLGEGAWYNDKSGALECESVLVYSVACEAKDNTKTRLAWIADNVGRLGKQLAVYVQYPDGQVDIRDTANLWRVGQ